MLNMSPTVVLECIERGLSMGPEPISDFRFKAAEPSRTVGDDICFSGGKHGRTSTDFFRTADVGRDVMAEAARKAREMLRHAKPPPFDDNLNKKIDNCVADRRKALGFN